MSLSSFSQRAIQIVAENKIQQAREQGKFDNLPGHGKPLDELDQPHDPDWWTKKLARRESLGELSREQARQRVRERADQQARADAVQSQIARSERQLGSRK